MLDDNVNTMNKKDVPAEVSKYMSELGKKGGARNKAKGTAYFKWIRRQGKKRPVKDSNENNS